ncbi:hypothetical protein HY003_02650 [Candidatus Saccharibacteria bacterium]|nr:hypothetical protein [Candidatus Saccharibacteria bacterium]MBI3338177.1 hypothetical protein [Candidatus Saccharibacteria bacterium]
MKLIKYVWLGSILAGILLFIDDIAGTDVENGEGLVVANKGLLTGIYSWRLLALTGMVFLITSLLLVLRMRRK